MPASSASPLRRYSCSRKRHLTGVGNFWRLPEAAVGRVVDLLALGHRAGQQLVVDGDAASGQRAAGVPSIRSASWAAWFSRSSRSVAVDLDDLGRPAA